MGRALELISATKTAPTQTEADFAAVSGDSLRVRNSKGAMLVGMWQHRQTAGLTRVKSPLMHDSTRGLFARGPAGTSWLWEGRQMLESNDQLTVSGTGSATGGDVENSCLLINYADLPGTNGRFLSPIELAKRAKQYTASSTSTASTAGGAYSGQTTFSEQATNLKAGRDYAVLGVTVQGVSSGYAAIGLRAPDWGNLRIGIPCVAVNELTGWQYTNFFVRLSERLGMAMIPVFSADNVDQMFMDLLCDEDFGTLTYSVQLAELSGGRS